MVFRWWAWRKVGWWCEELRESESGRGGSKGFQVTVASNVTMMIKWYHDGWIRWQSNDWASAFLLHQNVWKVKINYLFILWRDPQNTTPQLLSYYTLVFCQLGCFRAGWGTNYNSTKAKHTNAPFLCSALPCSSQFLETQSQREHLNNWFWIINQFE